MTQQFQKTHHWAEELRRREEEAQKPRGEAVFFFDGEFRTWEQVQMRSQINMAVAALAVGFASR